MYHLELTPKSYELIYVRFCNRNWSMMAACGGYVVLVASVECVVYSSVTDTNDVIFDWMALESSFFITFIFSIVKTNMNQFRDRTAWIMVSSRSRCDWCSLISDPGHDLVLTSLSPIKYRYVWTMIKKFGTVQFCGIKFYPTSFYFIFHFSKNPTFDFRVSIFLFYRKLCILM
jgi:hypothetical protein